MAKDASERKRRSEEKNDWERSKDGLEDCGQRKKATGPENGIARFGGRGQKKTFAEEEKEKDCLVELAGDNCHAGHSGGRRSDCIPGDGVL